jgi:hypothetical protein
VVSLLTRDLSRNASIDVAAVAPDSKASLVRMVTPWTVKTVPAVADAVTRRTVTEEATGERVPLVLKRPRMVRLPRMVSRPKERIVSPASPASPVRSVRSASPSPSLKRRKSASPSTTTWQPSRLSQLVLPRRTKSVLMTRLRPRTSRSSLTLNQSSQLPKFTL